MKISPSFVLVLAAASTASASPLLRRGAADSTSTSSMSAPTTSAMSSVSMGNPSGTASAPMASGTANAGPVGSGPASGGSNSTSSGSNSTSSGTQTFTDTQVLQYALTLEHLEATFYNQSLSKLSTSDFENAGYNASIRNQIYAIGQDEVAHVDLLSSALGNNSIPACEYDFSSVTDVYSFLTTARVLEGVGVSAYLGAAQNITNKAYLEVAGSILVTEGKHDAILTAQTDDGGNAVPNAFATPLDFKQVYSLAAPFIKSCPTGASLPITAFPSLSLTGGASNGSFTPGQQVTVSYSESSSSNSSSSGGKYVAFIQGIGAPQFVSLSGNNASVTLPSNLTGGQMYAVVTSSNTAVTDDNTLAGPAVGFVNIPLPEAPEATGSISSGSASSSSSFAAPTSTDSASVAGGSGAAPTGSMSAASSSMSMPAMPTGSTPSMSGAAPTGSMSAPASLISAASGNLPKPTSSA